MRSIRLSTAGKNDAGGLSVFNRIAYFGVRHFLDPNGIERRHRPLQPLLGGRLDFLFFGSQRFRLSALSTLPFATLTSGLSALACSRRRRLLRKHADSRNQ